MLNTIPSINNSNQYHLNNLNKCRLPAPPKQSEVLSFIKPTKKHLFGADNNPNPPSSSPAFQELSSLREALNDARQVLEAEKAETTRWVVLGASMGAWSLCSGIGRLRETAGGKSPWANFLGAWAKNVHWIFSLDMFKYFSRNPCRYGILFTFFQLIFRPSFELCFNALVSLALLGDYLLQGSLPPWPGCSPGAWRARCSSRRPPQKHCRARRWSEVDLQRNNHEIHTSTVQLPVVFACFSIANG